MITHAEIDAGRTLANANPRRHTRQATRWLALCAVVGPLLFTVAWFILGFLTPGYVLFGTYISPYSAISQPVSGLSLGVTGPFMNGAFIVSGVLVIAGVIGIVAPLDELGTFKRSCCAVLLALPGAGSIVDGLFTLESMLLHLVGFLLVLTPIIGFPVTGLMLRSIPGWRRFGTRLTFGGPITLILAGVFFASFDPEASGRGAGFAGLAQRALLIEIHVWYVALGWAAFRRPAADVAQNRDVTPPGRASCADRR